MNKKTQQKLLEIFDFAYSGELLNARKAAQSLESVAGNFPELKEAAWLLDRLELLTLSETFENLKKVEPACCGLIYRLIKENDR